MTADAELEALSKRLRTYRGREDDPERPPGGFLASVAVVLRPGKLPPEAARAQGLHSAELLLIHRAESPPDPWSGHIAFPGGRRSAADTSLVETAERETWEETGIALAQVGELLGRLTEVSPRLRRVPPLVVAPFVYRVPAETPVLAASAEVAESFWVPLWRFRIEGARATHVIETGTDRLSFPAFDLDGRVVWGLTHRILVELIGHVP